MLIALFRSLYFEIVPLMLFVGVKMFWHYN